MQIQNLLLKDKIDLWSAFLTKYDILNTANLTGSFDDPDLKKALGILEVMNLNKDEREEYESHLKWLRIETNTLKKAENKGREEGREAGKKERDIEIAKLMLSKKKPIGEIIEFTGLTESEVKFLKI